MGYRHVALSLSAAVLIAPLAGTGTAHASDGISQNAFGTYTLAWKPGGEPSVKWVMTPCDDDAPRCVNVAQYWLTAKNPYATGNAYWSVGSWIMQLPSVQNLITCKDSDQKFDYPATFSWDSDTNEGLRSYIDPGLCPDAAHKGKDVSSNFYLTKVSSDAPAPASTPAPTPSPAPPAPSPSPSPAPPAAPAAETPAPAAEAPAAAPAPAPAPLPAPGAAESTAPPPAA